MNQFAIIANLIAMKRIQVRYFSEDKKFGNSLVNNFF